MSIVVTMNPEPQPMDAETKSRLNSVPAWGSYLYQNFVLPAFSPTASMSEWLNLNTPFAALTPRATQQPQQQQQNQGPMDYFGGGWVKTEEGVDQPEANDNHPSTSNAVNPYNIPHQQLPTHPPSFNQYSFGHTHQSQPSAPSMQHSVSQPSFQRNSDPGPSSYYAPTYGQYPFNPSSIATSLLLSQHQQNFSAPSAPQHTYNHRPSMDRPGQPISRDSLNIVDRQLTHSPSPLTSRSHTPHQSPKQTGKRRFDSLDSTDDHDHDTDHEQDAPEGVERDGMIWGMQVDAYRALSARERKRVRNRISARTFRAKRKEHLSLLEESASVKDLKLRLANEETQRLKMEVAELRRRLALYES